MNKFAAFAVLVLHRASADVCSNLDSFLNLHGGSYNKGLVCHGLFWTSTEKKSICFYSTATKDVCPATWAVSVREAEVFLAAPSTSSTTTSVSPSTTGSGMSSSSAPSTTPSTTTVFTRVPSTPSWSFLALGDWGLRSESLTTTIDKINAKFFATAYPLKGVFLLGDNFYPRGIRQDLSIRDPQFNLFSDLVAAQAPQGLRFYSVLGNHDWMGDTRAQISFSTFDTRWVFPALYYFQRFALDHVSVCVWFIDTETFASDAGQQGWFRESLASERSTCAWTIVNGHYPVFTGGEYTGCSILARYRQSVLPIIRANNIDLYFSGHEHQSQILKEDDFNTVYVVAGAVSDMRGVIINGNENLKWIDSRFAAFAEVQVEENESRVIFHKSSGGMDAEPLCQSRLSKTGLSRSVFLTLSGCEV
jgi:tartrate-resistant acid phosphatase type 5